MSSIARKASGQMLVVGIFLGILTVAVGLWLFTRNSSREAGDQFVTLMNSGKNYAANGDTPRALEAFRTSDRKSVV